MEHTEPIITVPGNRINPDDLTPRKIVEELGRYIIGQEDAKKSVAVAIRNRYRRRQVPEEIRDEIYPKNIIMIGPTGCGKTEIARRLSRLTGAPFVKVEATKYTEVGYVGRDVESMIRELVNTSINMVRKEFREVVEARAAENAENRLLDLLLPSTQKKESGAEQESQGGPMGDIFRAFSGMSDTGRSAQAGLAATGGAGEASIDGRDEERREKARELFRKKLRDGDIEEQEVELEVQAPTMPMVQVMSGTNMEEIDMQVQNMLGDILPRKQKRKRLTIAEARKVIMDEEVDKLVDPDRVQMEAIRRAEQMGIIFLDELDKICGRGGMQAHGPDVSREGVQRDLLPIVEGATVNTRHGPVKTDHILFIAAGAFHASKPSDLIPELQGRFPIRVELDKLSRDDFKSILINPRNSLTKQYQALMATEKIELEFTEDGISEIADIAFQVNEQTENIGARRLYTIMERVLEELSFEASELQGEERKISVDRAFVQDKLKSIVHDRDLSKYIL